MFLHVKNEILTEIECFGEFPLKLYIICYLVVIVKC
jgi:hypothetical protein